MKTDVAQVCLIFDSHNRCLVQRNAAGFHDLISDFEAVEAQPQLWCVVDLVGTQTEIFCHQVEDGSVAGCFLSIYQLEYQDLSSQTLLSPPARCLLLAIQPELHRLPYLKMGENEYIYRFRTARERNRSVYVDNQSGALYQSALCAVIKAARRTKEKSSGEPAVLNFGPVSYVIPSHFGFCLGVQNAIERAYETVALNPGKRVFMLSELIHNPFVNEDLLARGLRYLQTDKGLMLTESGKVTTQPNDPDSLWNQLTDEDIVIIPAFGATNEDKARLIRRGLSVRENDATCMLVEKVWKAARRYAKEGYTVLIHGKSEHEETKATFSNSSSHGHALMLRNMEHARHLAEIIQADASEKQALFESYFSGLCSEGFDPIRDLERIAVVNQTTLLRNETLEIIDYLRSVIAEKYGEAKVAEHLWSKGKGDTLCYATQVNQDALQKAVEQPIDAALVVGGKNSSNTFQLYRVCQERFGDNAHYIQSESNIHSMETLEHYIFPYNLKETPTVCEAKRPFLQADGAKKHILLTGGASCPDGIIQQVIHKINSFFPAESLRSMESILEGFESES
ncbi:MAG: 4-hydroxy-3-methylbut-2-enyl diphosphate reductase [Lentimonas sp.]